MLRRINIWWKSIKNHTSLHAVISFIFQFMYERNKKHIPKLILISRVLCDKIFLNINNRVHHVTQYSIGHSQIIWHQIRSEKHTWSRCCDFQAKWGHRYLVSRAIISAHDTDSADAACAIYHVCVCVLLMCCEERIFHSCNINTCVYRTRAKNNVFL